MKKKIIIFFMVVVFGLVFFSQLNSDDREIFSASVKPYVFFILDNSGSMGNDDFFVANIDSNPDKLANFQSYTTTTGKTYTYATEEEYTGGYWQRYWNWRRRRWAWRWIPGESTGDHYATRITALRRATTELVDKTRDSIKIGMSHFFYEGSGSTRSHGGLVFADMDDYSSGDAARDTAFDALTDYINSNVNADHYTPLAESMDTAYGYFAGMISSGDGNQWTDMYGNTRIPIGSMTPEQYTCQRTFVILITDGAPTADDANYGYPSPYTGLAMINNPSTLPDVAAYLYDNPISPAQDGIVTYTVGMRMEGSGKTLLETTADMNHGHGEYYPGDDFDQLIENLQKVILSIEQRNYAFTEYTSPKKITTADDNYNVSYSGYFFSNSDLVPIWEGHLKCYDIIPDEDTYMFYEVWDAATQMNAQGEANRSIYTDITATGDHNFVSTPVDFITTNSSLLQNALNADDDAQSTEIIEYIRGANRPDVEPEDMFMLADIFHSTVAYLGRPFLWKAFYNPPECDLNNTETDTDCYQKFYLDNETRGRVIFVGTNDGVVHTLNAEYDAADGGKEISGFIPDELLPSLKNIAINRQFTYTADGLATVNDIYTGPTDKWKTVLVFGLREGGKAFYGRDVTDPLNQSTRWKFPAYMASASIANINGTTYTLSSVSGTFEVNQYVVNERRTAKGLVTAVSGVTDEITVSVLEGAFSTNEKILAQPNYTKYIGETWGKPKLARIKYKKGTDGTLEDRWVAILPGGFSEEVNDEGKAVFILDAWTGELIWWLAYASSDSITDDQYLKNDSNLDYPIPQSLTAVDKDNNTYVDTVYFGNLGGNMFKLDISDPLTSTWIPKIIFRENDTDQPIYLSPSISYDQCYSLWVHFGTGNRVHPQDGPTGRFIAIRDDSTIPSTGCVRDTDLQMLSWSGSTLAETNITGANGWYFDFPDSNEILFDPEPIVVPNSGIPYIYFNTYQPSSVVVNGDPCGAGGNMTFYSIGLHTCGDIVSGDRESARISGGGLLSGSEYLMYVGTGETGSLEIKRFEKFDIKPVGGIIYWKETKR